MAFVSESVALATDVEYMAVVQKPVADRGGDHSIAEEFSTLGEALVGSQDQAATFVPG